jgi:cold-inducible RNA-binding protein
MITKKRLYIGNLPAATTDTELRTRFERFGTVESAIVVRDVETGRSKRCGFVEMASGAEARAAIEQLNMTQYEDVVISVREAPAEKHAG